MHNLSRLSKDTPPFEWRCYHTHIKLFMKGSSRHHTSPFRNCDRTGSLDMVVHGDNCTQILLLEHEKALYHAKGQTWMCCEPKFQGISLYSSIFHNGWRARLLNQEFCAYTLWFNDCTSRVYRGIYWHVRHHHSRQEGCWVQFVGAYVCPCLFRFQSWSDMWA
jgi:hypothetical protein